MQVFQERVGLALDRDRRFTQEVVAERARAAGYPLGTNEVSKIRTGTTSRPGPAKVAGLAVGLAVKADWLLGLDDDPGPYWDLPEGPIAEVIAKEVSALRAAEAEASRGPLAPRSRRADGLRS